MKCKEQKDILKISQGYPGSTKTTGKFLQRLNCKETKRGELSIQKGLKTKEEMKHLDLFQNNYNRIQIKPNQPCF